MVCVMRLVFVVAFLPLLVVASFAAPGFEDEFSPEYYTSNELGIIQRALSLTGYYDALWDEEWGPLSQAALERFRRDRAPEVPLVNGLLVVLLAESLEVFDEVGWQETELPTLGAYLGYPTKFLSVSKTNSREFVLTGEGLYVRVFAEEPRSLSRQHATIMQSGVTGSIYKVRNEARWVSSSKARDGLITYLRSDRTSIGWVSLLVTADEAHARDVRLITSSFGFGEQARDPLRMPNLMALLEETEKFLAENGNSSEGERSSPQPKTKIADASPTEPAADDRLDVIGSGTGFFISNLLLITNYHVVSECEALTDKNFDEMRLVTADAERDLALLQHSGVSSQYLSLSTADIQLGDQVSALGFPMYGLINTQLTFTSGVISSTKGADDNEYQFTLTAPIQPGNSGGPVLNRKGQVVGVVVSKADSITFVNEFGFIPQNFNFAIKNTTLLSFLDRNDVLYSTQESAIDLEDGIPPGIQEAVTPVLCLG